MKNVLALALLAALCSPTLAEERPKFSCNAGGGQADFNGNAWFDSGDLVLLAGKMVEFKLDPAGFDPSDLVTFDLTNDNLVNFGDLVFWVKDPSICNSWIGDSNLDGEFNSADFVGVFQAAEYEDDIVGNSTWATGDWDGNKEFETTDFGHGIQ